MAYDFDELNSFTSDLDSIIAGGNDAVKKARRIPLPKTLSIDETKVASILDRLQDGTSEQETEGMSAKAKLRAVNPDSGAAGEFQVLPVNVPTWTQKHLKRRMTVEQFKNDPQAQRAVFRGEMGDYLRRALRRARGDENTAIRMAAAAWYGGLGSMGLYDDPKPQYYKGDRSKKYPSFREYTTKVLQRTKGQLPGTNFVDFLKGLDEIIPVDQTVRNFTSGLDAAKDQPTVISTGIEEFRKGLETIIPSPTFPSQFPQPKIGVPVESVTRPSRPLDAGVPADVPDGTNVGIMSDTKPKTSERTQAELNADVKRRNAEAKANNSQELLEQYEGFLKSMGLPDTADTRKLFNDNLKRADKAFQQEIKKIEDADQAATAEYNQKYRRKAQETPAASGTSERYAVDKPIDTDEGEAFSVPTEKNWSYERRVRFALKSDKARQYGITPQEAEQWIADRKRRGVALLGSGGSDTKTGIPFYVIGEIKGADAAETIRRMEETQSQKTPADLRLRAPRLSQAAAEEAIDRRIRETDYFLTQKISEELSDPIKLMYYGVFGRSEEEIAELTKPSDEWIKKEKDRLLTQYGDYSEAWNAERNYQNISGLETTVRVASQVVRSFGKNLVGGTAETGLYLSQLLEDANPINLALPDNAKIGLRNVGNLLEFVLRLVSSRSAETAYNETEWIDSKDLSKQHLWKAMQEFNQSVGDDPVLKGRFLGQFADAGGSALAFIALGAVMPELAVVSKAGKAWNIGAGLAGSIQMAGAGYKEGKQAGLDESSAKWLGGVQAALGLSEMLGAGAAATQWIKNPAIRSQLAEGILQTTKAGGKGFIREGKQEFGQEVFQTSTGKAALEYLKDSEPETYIRVWNALNRLPSQIADAVAKEGPIAIITGGVLGAAGSTAQAITQIKDAQNNETGEEYAITDETPDTYTVQTDDGKTQVIAKEKITLKPPVEMYFNEATKQWEAARTKPVGEIAPPGEVRALQSPRVRGNQPEQPGPSETPIPLRTSETEAMRIDTPDPNAVQTASVETRTRKIAEALKGKDFTSIDEIAKQTRINKTNVEDAILTLYGAGQVELNRTTGDVRLVNESETAQRNSLLERAKNYGQPTPQISQPPAAPVASKPNVSISETDITQIPPRQSAPESIPPPEFSSTEIAEAAQAGGLATKQISPEQQRREAGQFTKDGVEYVRQEPIGESGKGSELELRFADKEPPVRGRWGVVDDATIQPAHINGVPNLNTFIPEAQPNIRTDDVSKESSDAIAREFDIARDVDASNPYFGPPTVNTRGEVIQGNKRSDAIRKRPKDVVERNRTWLLDNAERFGLDPKQIQNTARPALVRIVDASDVDAIRLGQYEASDLESGGRKSFADPGRLSTAIPHEAKGTILSDVFLNAGEESTLTELIRDNAGAVSRQLKPYLSPDEYQTLFGGGKLSPKAVENIKEIFTGFLFSNGGADLPLVFEDLPHHTKQGLKQSLPAIFSVSENASLVPEIQNGIKAAVAYQQSGINSFDNWVNQADMLAGGMTPNEIFTPAEIELAKRFVTARRQSDIKSLLTDYATLINGREAGLFEGPTPGVSKAEAVKEIFNVEHRERELPAARYTAPAAKEEVSERGSEGLDRRADERTRAETPSDAGAAERQPERTTQSTSIAPRPTLHGLPPQTLDAPMTARVLYAKERGMTETDIAQRYNLTPEQVAAVGELPQVGNFGQMSYRLIQASIPAKQATDTEIAEKTAFVNDLAAELNLPVRLERGDPTETYKNASDTIRTAIATEMGKERASELSQNDWFKWLDAHVGRLDTNTVETLLDSIGFQTEHTDKVNSFFVDKNLGKILDKIDESIGLANIQKFTSIPNRDDRNAILSLAKQYGIRTHAAVTAFNNTLPRFVAERNAPARAETGSHQTATQKPSERTPEGASDRPRRAEELDEPLFTRSPSDQQKLEKLRFQKEYLLGTPQVEVNTKSVDRIALWKNARKKFQGKFISNIEFGKPIRITGTGLKHAKAWSQDIRKAQALEETGPIIEKGSYLGSENPRKSETNIKAYHHLATPVAINGEKLIVETIVRETTSGDLFYDFNIADIVNPAGSSSGAARVSETNLQPSAGYGSTLLQKVLNFNEKTDKPLFARSNARLITDVPGAVDLWGNAVSTTSLQQTLFDIAPTKESETFIAKQESRDRERVYGKTAQYIQKVLDSDDSDGRMKAVAQKLFDARFVIEKKGKAGRELIEDAADALGAYTFARKLDTPLEQILPQQDFELVTLRDKLSPRGLEFAQAMEQGNFNRVFDNAERELPFEGALFQTTAATPESVIQGQPLLSTQRAEAEGRRLGQMSRNVRKKDPFAVIASGTFAYNPTTGLVEFPNIEGLEFARGILGAIDRKYEGQGWTGATLPPSLVKRFRGHLDAAYRFFDARGEKVAARTVAHNIAVIDTAIHPDHGNLGMAINIRSLPELSKYSQQEERAHLADMRTNVFDKTPFEGADGYEQAQETLRGEGYSETSIHREILGKLQRDDAAEALGITPRQVDGLRSIRRQQLFDAGMTAQQFLDTYGNISESNKRSAQEYANRFQSIRTRTNESDTSGGERSSFFRSGEVRTRGDTSGASTPAPTQSRPDLARLRRAELLSASRSGTGEEAGLARREPTGLAESESDALFARISPDPETLHNEADSNFKKLLGYIYDGKRDVPVAEAVTNIIRTGYLAGVSVIKTNLHGNTLNIVTEQLSKPAMALVDIINAKYNPKAKGMRYVPGLSIGDITAGFFGKGGILREGLFDERGFFNALIKGIPLDEAKRLDMQMADKESNFVRNTGVPLFDVIIEGTKRLVIGIDRPFKAFARTAEMRGLARVAGKNAVAQGLDTSWRRAMKHFQRDPSVLMHDLAERYAETLTFQNPNPATDLYDRFRSVLLDEKELAKLIPTAAQHRLTKYLGAGAYVATTSTFPFVRTPTNIGIRTMEYILPTGAVSAAWKFYRIGQGFERTHWTEEVARARARLTTDIAVKRGKEDVEFKAESNKYLDGFARRNKAKSDEFVTEIEKIKASKVLTEKAQKERIAGITARQEKWLATWKEKRDQYLDTREEVAELTDNRRRVADMKTKDDWAREDVVADVKFTAFENRQFAEAAGRMTFGTVAGGLILLGVFKGLIDMVGTTDYDDEKGKWFAKRAAGIPDDSVRIGIYRFPYGNNPFGNALKIGVNVMEQYERPGPASARVSAVAERTVKDVTSLNPFTQSEFTKDDWASWAGSKANSITPILNMKVMQEIGEVMDKQPRKYWEEGFTAQYLIKIPVARESLPVAKTYVGERGDRTRRLIRLFDPLKTTREIRSQKSLPVSKLLQKKKQAKTSP